MDIRYKAAKIRESGEDGLIVGYGSVFGVKDRYGEIVDSGAFKKTLSERMPKMLWQHDARLPIGVWHEAAETNRGLRLSGMINLETRTGQEAHALVRQGAVDGLSIGYIPVTVVEEMKDEEHILHIKEVKLYETSVVTFPANESALISAVKEAKDIAHIAELLTHFAPHLAVDGDDEHPICDSDEAATKSQYEPDIIHSLESLIRSLRKQ